jgi:hypothetical protein
MGAARSTPSSAYADTGLFNSYMSAGTEAENENIAFDELFVEYMSPIGQLKVGYQQSGIAGTVFGDNNWIMPKISFGTKIGNLSVGISYAKQQENSKNAKSVLPYGTQSDVDDDSYSVGVNYGTEWGSFGLIGKILALCTIKIWDWFPPSQQTQSKFFNTALYRNSLCQSEYWSCKVAGRNRLSVGRG